MIALVLVVTAAALVTLQSRQLNAGIDDALRLEANALVGDGAPDVDRLLSSETVAQITSADGTVRQATEGLSNLAPIAPVPSGIEAVTIQVLPIDDDAFRVLSRRIPAASGELVLHVGISGEDVGDSTRALVVAAAVLVPFVVATLAALVWWMVGRTLQPVERIRREVATISGDRGRRVSEPSTDDEIGRLARTMNEMLERIDVAIDRQRRFVADASHELRTPLTRIRTEVEVGAGDVDSAGQSPLLASVLEETVGLQRLIDDLLLLARADAGVVSPGADRVDLDDLALLAAANIRRSGAVAVDTGGIGAAQAVGDAAQFARVAANLADNAVRHARSRVWLETFEADAVAYLVVGNDGPPIPPDQFSHLFQRFSRLDEARSSDRGGTGLGLAIVKEIVDRHGGSVAVESTESATIFTVGVPAVASGGSAQEPPI